MQRCQDASFTACTALEPLPGCAALSAGVALCFALNSLRLVALFFRQVQLSRRKLVYLWPKPMFDLRTWEAMANAVVWHTVHHLIYWTSLQLGCSFVLEVVIVNSLKALICDTCKFWLWQLWKAGNSWATSGKNHLLHFSLLVMGISFNTTVCEQLRLRNGCFALSAISAPRAVTTDRWGTWHKAVTPQLQGRSWQSFWNEALHSQSNSYVLLVHATAR